MQEIWQMPWNDFAVVVGNIDSSKIRSLSIRTPDRAARFLRNAGFDLSIPSQKMKFDQFFTEAIFFIRHILLKSDEREIYPLPDEIAHMEDFHQLLMLASDLTPQKRYKRYWALGIVKVIFSISNLEHNEKILETNLAKNQMFARIREIIVSEGGNTFLQFRGQRVPLRTLDWKESKTRNSILLKLLHKPESVVDEVYDYIGVRFVAKRTSDLPHLIKLLIESDVIIPHQILTIRTRNSLLFFDKGKRHLDTLVNLLSTDVITCDELESMARRIQWTFTRRDEPPRSSNNAFTSERYRAFQITVRHLVRLPNPAYLVVNSLSQQVRHYRGLEHDDSDLTWIVPPEITRYFPIEIQVLDSDSYDIAQFGPASHERYKAAQLESVRKRILGGMLRMTPEWIGMQI